MFGSRVRERMADAAALRASMGWKKCEMEGGGTSSQVTQVEQRRRSIEALSRYRWLERRDSEERMRDGAQDR
jgi:hypothetical protein